MKLCPECHCKNADGKKECFCCQHTFKKGEPAVVECKNTSIIIKEVEVICALLILPVIILAVFASTGGVTGNAVIQDDRGQACVAAEAFVRENSDLNIPATAQFQPCDAGRGGAETVYLGERIYTTTFFVDTQDAAGKNIRTTYFVKNKDAPNGVDWPVLDWNVIK